MLQKAKPTSILANNSRITSNIGKICILILQKCMLHQPNTRIAIFGWKSCPSVSISAWKTSYLPLTTKTYTVLKANEALLAKLFLAKLTNKCTVICPKFIKFAADILYVFPSWKQSFTIFLEKSSSPKHQAFKTRAEIRCFQFVSN